MQEDLDDVAAHERFSVGCFDRARDLMDKQGRTAEEDEEMLLCAHAALWHSMKSPDFAPAKRAMGHWQLSRVNGLIGRAESALAHARLALEAARDLNASVATTIAGDMPPAATDTIPAGVREDAPPNGSDDHEPALLLGAAHEAMARAHRLLGEDEKVEFHRAEAWRLADEVVDAEARARLLADVDELRGERAA